MLKNILFPIALLLGFSLSSTAQEGMVFFEGEWEEAIAKAKKENKIIFVDAYTTWCGPCKQMKKYIFPDRKVGEFYNRHFINLKLDMEKTAGRLFEKKYPVSSYPTFYFIDGDGKVVYKTKGAMNTEKFLKLGATAVRKSDNSGDFAKRYEKGERDYNLIFNYVKALNKAGKSSLKIANDYIKSQKDLTTPENLAFILESTTEADSKVFELLTKHKKAILANHAQTVVDDKISSACHKTALKAIEFEYFDLIKEASNKMEQHFPKEGKEFELTYAMKYYLAFSDIKNYTSTADKLAKLYKKQPTKMYILAEDVFIASQQEKTLLPQAEKYAQKAASNGTDIAPYLTHAQILTKMGKHDKAIKVYQKALKIAEKNDKPIMKERITQFIKSLEQEK